MKNQIDNKEIWVLKLLEFILENLLGTDWPMLKNENPTFGWLKTCQKVNGQHLELGKA